MKSTAHNIAFILILIFCGVSLAYAQIPPVRVPSNALSPLTRNRLVPPFALIATPSSPSPGAQVTVTTETTSFDPNRTNYTWTVDGNPRPDISGFGKNSFTFTAGAVGSSNLMSVRAEPINDRPITASLTVYTSDLSMTWTARTYTPKWYKGKALPVPKAMVRVAAIPTFIIDGATIPANKLIYTWDNNGERVLRGVGKQILEFQEPDQLWNAPTIVLTIEDSDNRIQKEGRVMVVGQVPHAVIYQLLPLGGVEFRRGSSAFPSTPPSVVDIQVEPFFFNRESKRDLSYAWSVQGDIASSSPRNPFILTLDMQQQPPSNIPIYIEVKDNVPNTDLYSPLASSFLNIPIGK